MKNFTQQLQTRFTAMQQTGKLFRVALTGDEIWNLYINSFTTANNPVFRDPASSTKNCNHCKNFLRRYGNIVAVDENYELITLFDIQPTDEFQNTAATLYAAIKASPIINVFYETFTELNKLPYETCKKSNKQFQLGTASNPKRYTREEAEKYGVVKENETRLFNHMHLFVQNTFVDQTGASVEALMGQYRDAKNVFERAMVEIPLDTLQLVRDLINQGSLLDGTTHLYKIEQILPLKKQYDALAAHLRNNWCWVNSYKLPYAKFKNELIGTLCTELAEGEELNKACQAWNKRVDPANYMKAKAPITQFQIDKAKAFVEENGYTQSFNRRFATIADIDVSEIRHINAGTGTLKTASMFDGVKATSTRHKRNEFAGVEEVGIEKFMKDILPTCTSIEAFLSNAHAGNMLSLTTANIPESKPIFKWTNNYSWTFNGNLAGKSQIKEAVKMAGGKVDGVLRFSIVWNDAEQNDRSDLDAWCQQPNNQRIGFNTEFRKDMGGAFSACGGQLDVDDRGYNTKVHVENIYFKNIQQMQEGKYLFWVNQYSASNSKGFKAEVEFDGEIYSYEYNQPVSGNVQVANVTLKNGQFTIEHLLPEAAVSTKQVYGLNTNQFHKVNLVCLTPNHWGANNVGNKHYLFMLEGCKAPSAIRSFHAENLLPELAEHRKVFEVLGATNMIEPTDGEQLSGLGFNSTVTDELIVKLQGTHKRMVKIRF